MSSHSFYRSRGVLAASLFAVLGVVSGCKAEDPAPDADHIHADEHVHTAPHGGELVVARAEFAHVEIVLDNTTGTLTAYLLGAHAEKPVRSDAVGIDVQLTIEDRNIDLTLRPIENELSGERIGDTSQFSATSKDLIGASHLEGKLGSVALRGETFTGLTFHIHGH